MKGGVGESDFSWLRNTSRKRQRLSRTSDCVIHERLEESWQHIGRCAPGLAATAESLDDFRYGF